MAETSNSPINGPGDRDPPPGGLDNNFWYNMFTSNQHSCGFGLESWWSSGWDYEPPPGGLDDDFWFTNNQESCGSGLESPGKQRWSSRRDYEWGDVLDKSSKTKMKRNKTDMGCLSSAVNSASDISEALSSISAALSLSSSDSSSNSSARGKDDQINLALSLPNQDMDEMLPSHSDGDERKSKSTVYASEKKGFQVPEIGMTFSSDEEAYDFYKRYAEQTGFRVRRGKVQRLADGTIRKRYFFCSREGFRLAKQSNKVTKYKRKETRTGCNALIQCIVEDGKWIISQVCLEHNHQLITGQRHEPYSKASDGAAGRSMACSPSPSAPHSPHLSGHRSASSTLVEQEKYLSGLLAERRKLSPFLAVLPNTYRLLNQEILRVTTMLGNASVLGQSGLEHASPLASEGIFSNEGADANGWASRFQSEMSGVLQALSAQNWLSSQGSSSGLIVKRIIRADIPVDKYPNYDFVGRLLGPEGNSLKQVEATTECRVQIRGRGSIKDPTREEFMRGKPGYEHLNEPPHIHVEAELPVEIVDARLMQAREMLEDLLKHKISTRSSSSEN